jgi:hypothetical protein
MFYKDRCYHKSIGYAIMGDSHSWSGTTSFTTYFYKKDSLVNFNKSYNFPDRTLAMQRIEEYARIHNQDLELVTGQRRAQFINDVEYSKMIFFRSYCVKSL